MPVASAEELMARLAIGQPVAGVLLLGTDSYLRDVCRKKLVEAFVPEGSRAWAVTRLSLEDASLTHALQQAQTLPMLSPRQVIFVSDLGALARLGDENREAAEKELEAYLSSPAPFSVLVLEAESLDQRTRIFKILSSGTLVVSVELGEGKPDEKRVTAIAASQRLMPQMARELGAAIDADAAAELAEATNGELARIHTELQKLALYVGKEKAITAEDVDALVVSEQKTSVWQLADMLADRKGGRALEFIDQLIREGEQPAGLVGGMSWMYRKLLEAHDAPRHLDGWAAAGYLKMQRKSAELALTNARKISRGRLLNGLTALYDADSQLKGGAADPRAVLEFLVVQLTA